MFGIIWMIIVGYVIYKAVRRREEENNTRKRTDMSMPPNNRPVGRMVPHTGQTPLQTKTQQESQTKQGSTMAYLEEKARQDEAEHAREKQEEARRLYQNAGGLRAAQRRYEGDSVPNGKRCVVCGYCGAENLLPVVSREQYSCYFCREALR